jgi:hypothetical protein
MARNEETVGNTGAAASATANGHTTIDWTRKLTSRKFWLSVASFVAMLLVALGKSQETAAQVTSLIMAGATVIGYTIGEGLADGHGEYSGHGDSAGRGETVDGS